MEEHREPSLGCSLMIHQWTGRKQAFRTGISDSYLQVHSVVTVISHAVVEDAPAILGLQRLAYQSEARLYSDWTLPPLTQTLESLQDELAQSIVLKAVIGEQLVGSVRAKAVGHVGQIGRLIVHPEHQGRGLGSELLGRIEVAIPDVSILELFTGTRSESNIRLYQRLGYQIFRTQELSAAVTIAYMRKFALVDQ